MLPKIEHPTFEVTVPSTSKKIRMRQMLVKEEKILLMAKQAESRKEIIDAVIQIVNNCIVGDFDIKRISLFDLEYLFIKLRAASISNIAKVSYRDNEDDKVYDFDIDLDKLALTKNDKSNAVEAMGWTLSLRYPPLSMYMEEGFFDLNESEVFDRILASSIDKVFETASDTAYSIDGASKEEIQAFVDSIPAKAYAPIRDFFVNAPSLFHEIRYTNTKGTERVIKMTTLDDFFIFV